MKTTTYLQIIFIIFFAITAGCKPLKIIPANDFKPLPASFDGSNDSASAATVNWKKYFSDNNLTSLIDTVLANNWDVLIAAQRIQAAKSNVLAANGTLRPFVNAAVAGGITKYGSYTMDGAGNKNTEIYNGKDIPVHLPDYLIGLQTNWELDIWGKLKNQKRATVSRLLATVEGRNVIVTNLVAEAATLYYELIAMDRMLHIVDETIKLRQNALEIVKVQKQAGVANDLAVKQLHAELLNVKAMRQEILQQITEAENSINVLAGRFPQQVLRDTSLPIQVITESVRPGVPANLLQNRPDIRRAELELVASKADVQSAKAAFYPSLNINGGIGLQAFKPGLLFTTPESFMYNIFASLTSPLINRSLLKAGLETANAQQKESIYNYRSTIITAYVEVSNQLSRIKNLQLVADIKKEEVEVLNKSVEISTGLFKTGRATYLEVLIAQQNALESQLQQLDAYRNQLIARVNIYKALGGGWK